MNTHQNIPDDANDCPPPPDVADIAAMLDELGAADRASMHEQGEQRIADAAMAACLHADVAIAVALGDPAAPSGLEQRVFEASRARLAGGRGLRLAGEGVLPARRVAAAWWGSGLARLAAAVLFAGAGVAVVITMRAGQVVPDPNGASVLAVSFSTEMEAFFDLLDSAPAAGAQDNASGLDHSVTEDLLEWESL